MRSLKLVVAGCSGVVAGFRCGGGAETNDSRNKSSDSHLYIPNDLDFLSWSAYLKTRLKEEQAFEIL